MGNNALFVSYDTTTATVYSIIRRKSDLAVYRPSDASFVTWINANIGTYDIPLTYDSGYLFSTDFPNIANDEYIVSFYAQAAGTPAITDTLLDSYNAFWNGVDTVAAAGSVILDGYALATLNQVKEEIGLDSTVTTYNDYLKARINMLSAEFEKKTNRKIVARDWLEFTWGKFGNIRPKYAPINYITRAAYGRQNAFWCTYSGYNLKTLAGTVQSPDGTDNYFKVDIFDSTGAQTTHRFQFSTYKCTDDIVSQLNNIDGIESYSAKNFPTKYMIPDVARDITNQNQYYCVLGIDTLESYYRKPEGLIGFRDLGMTFENVWIGIDYNAGYITVPYDINLGVISEVKNEYLMKGKNTLLQSETIGKYSYTKGNNVGGFKSSWNSRTDQWNSLIATWRRRVLA